MSARGALLAALAGALLAGAGACASDPDDGGSDDDATAADDDTTPQGWLCNGVQCAEDQDCCMVQDGLSADIQCVARDSCGAKVPGAEVCGDTLTLDDSVCDPLTEWCCDIPLVPAPLCFSQQSCPGQTPCVTTDDCVQFDELLPLVCCPEGVCDVDGFCGR